MTAGILPAASQKKEKNHEKKSYEAEMCTWEPAEIQPLFMIAMGII